MFGRGIFRELRYVATEFTDACKVELGGVWSTFPDAMNSNYLITLFSVDYIICFGIMIKFGFQNRPIQNQI